MLMRGGQSVRGWVGGNMADTLSFSVLFKVVPMVEVFPLEQAAARIREDDEREGAFPVRAENARLAAWRTHD